MTYLPTIGDIWEWEPLSPETRATVTVTQLRPAATEWMIEAEDAHGHRFWASAGRWMEAAVLVKAAT